MLVFITSSNKWVRPLALPHNVIINTAFATAVFTGERLVSATAAAERHTTLSLNKTSRKERGREKKYTVDCIGILNLIETEGELRCFEKHLSANLIWLFPIESKLSNRPDISFGCKVMCSPRSHKKRHQKKQSTATLHSDQFVSITPFI